MIIEKRHPQICNNSLRLLIGKMTKKLIPILFLFFGCTSSSENGNSPDSEPKKSETIKFPKDLYLVDAGGCVFTASVVIDSIGQNLFLDKNRNVYFRTFDRSDTAKGPIPVLISRIYNACEGDSTYDLSKNIDITSFCSLGNSYYKDKLKVFVHHNMLDGGNLGIVEEADTGSFKVFRHFSQYAIDKRHVYYQGTVVEKANPKTFKVIYKVNAPDTVGWYGRDDRNYFDGLSICKKEDVEDYLK